MSEPTQSDAQERAARRPGERRSARRRSSLFARGEPMVWLTGGSLVICLVMITGLLALVFSKGFGTFWPEPIDRMELITGTVRQGELNKEEEFQPQWTSFQSLEGKIPDE